MKRVRPTIGLALGSGGAKGLAHIGVLKVLEREGIPVDFIAGSSIGALIGGAYAAMRDSRRIEQLALQLNWPQLLPLVLDPALRHGLLRGHNVQKLLSRYVHADFSELTIPFTAVATDIVTGQPVLLREGSLAEAIRASISIPVLFRPVTYKQMILVDGGASMPVPAPVARQMGADIVIAVNINEHYAGIQPTQKFGIQRLINTSVSSLMVQLARENAKSADICVMPQVGQFGLFKKFMTRRGTAEVIAIGETAMEAALPQLRTLLDTYNTGLLQTLRQSITGFFHLREKGLQVD